MTLEELDTNKEEVIKTYTSGECPAMTRALQSLCKKQGIKARIGILYETDSGEDEQILIPIHVFAVLDGNVFLDVRGATTKTKMLSDWGYDDHTAVIDNDVSAKELERLYEQELLFEPSSEDIKEAKMFAKILDLVPRTLV